MARFDATVAALSTLLSSIKNKAASRLQADVVISGNAGDLLVKNQAATQGLSAVPLCYTDVPIAADYDQIEAAAYTGVGAILALDGAGGATRYTLIDGIWSPMLGTNLSTYLKQDSFYLNTRTGNLFYYGNSGKLTVAH